MAIIDFFDRGRTLNGQGAAFIMEGQRWSFDEAYGITCQVARALLDLGLAKEAKAAVLSGNHPVSWMCVLGLWRAGLAWVPLNPRGMVAEQQQLLHGFDVEVLFFQEAFAPLVGELRGQCPQLKRVVCIDGVAPDAESLPAWIAERP